MPVFSVSYRRSIRPVADGAEGVVFRSVVGNFVTARCWPMRRRVRGGGADLVPKVEDGLHNPRGLCLGAVRSRVNPAGRWRGAAGAWLAARRPGPSDSGQPPSWAPQSAIPRSGGRTCCSAGTSLRPRNRRSTRDGRSACTSASWTWASRERRGRAHCGRARTLELWVDVGGVTTGRRLSPSCCGVKTESHHPLHGN